MEYELSVSTAVPQRIPKRNGNRCFCVIHHNTSAHLLPTLHSEYSSRVEINNRHTKQYLKNVTQSKVQFSSFIPVIFVTAELAGQSLMKGREVEHELPSGPVHTTSWVNADLGGNLFLGRKSSWDQVSDSWGHSLTPAQTKKQNEEPCLDVVPHWQASSCATFMLVRWDFRNSCSRSLLSDLHPVGKPPRITVSLNYWPQSKQHQETFLYISFHLVLQVLRYFPKEGGFSFAGKQDDLLICNFI